ncbi:MAG: copper chaperone PCu(A)C [bacterium]|nr:copper chaperone PCu(A)C [bacterium]
MGLSRQIGITAWLLVCLSACAMGGEPSITVKGVTIVPSDAIKGSAASFLYLINDGRGSDKLVGCSIKEFPDVYVVLHDSVRGQMVIVKEIAVPGGETTALERGGLHIMFDGFPETPGSEITLILNFEKSGSIEAKATVL